MLFKSKFLTALMLCITILTCSLGLEIQDANAATLPYITSVSEIQPTGNQVVTINGVNLPVLPTGNDNNNGYISICDVSRGWQTGILNSNVYMYVTYSSSSQLVISGFGGQYGSLYVFNSGDSIAIIILQLFEGNSYEIGYWQTSVGSTTGSWINFGSITSVSEIQATGNQTVTINGINLPVLPIGNDNNNGYINIADVSRGWQTGISNAAVSMNVTYSSSSQLVISGFGGDYGSPYVFDSGDLIHINWYYPANLPMCAGYWQTYVGSPGGSWVPYWSAPNGFSISLSADSSGEYPLVSFNLPTGTSQAYLYRNNIQIATLNTSQTSYDDTSLTTPGNYNYYVLAVNSYGQTASNIVTFYFNPNSNNQLTADISNNQLVLSWKPNSSATSYNIIDNGTLIASVSSSTNSYTLSPSIPNSNQIYIQSITPSGYSASNIVSLDNMIPTKQPDFMFVAYDTNQAGFIGYLDGIFTKCLNKNNQNLILYPSNVIMCASAS